MALEDDTLETNTEVIDDTPVVDEGAAPVTDEIVTEEPVVESKPVVKPAAVKEEPKSMEDSIREKYRELKDPVPAADAPIPTGMVRDPKTGRFVEKPKEDPKAKAAEAAKVVDPAAAVAKPVTPNAADKPPASWGGKIAAKYAAIDPEVKAYIHKRENDFHKGLESYKGFADIGKQFHTEFSPYEAMIRAGNMTPQNLVKNWLNTEYQLKIASPEQKTELFLKYAQAYGISHDSIKAALAKATGVTETGEPVKPADPLVQSLQQRVDDLTKHFETDKNANARIEYDKIVNETKAFAETHPHMEAVKLDMAAMMETGRATSLEDAYNKATWANPEVRAILLEEQRAAEQRQVAERAAAARKAAGANVVRRGTTPAKPSATAANKGTMEDTIRAALHDIQSRAA